LAQDHLGSNELVTDSFSLRIMILAKSLTALKKHSQQFGAQLFDSDGRAEAWGDGAEDEVDEVEYYTGTEGPPLVRYTVQNGRDADPEGAVFEIGDIPGSNVTVGLVRERFPLRGNYHLRFKVPAPDAGFGFIWVDLAPNESVPVIGGAICMKVLRLPDDVEMYRSAPQGKQAPTQPQQVTESVLPSQGVGDAHTPPGPSIQTPLQGAAVKQDLMELDSAERLSPAEVPTPPVPFPNREELVAKREQNQRDRIQQTYLQHTEQRDKESIMKTDKVKVNSQIGAQMDAWARTPDGSSFKDISVLLTSLDQVIWPGSKWEPLSMSDLLMKESNVKTFYRKAIIICHPDRHQYLNAEQQVRADRIFQALNAAWKKQASQG